MVTATGFTPLLGSYETISGENPLQRSVAQILNRNSLRELKELMLTVNGVAVGSAALSQFSRVAAAVEMGGARTIEVIDAVNRNTAAADTTAIAADILAFPLEPTTYPANGDRNSRALGGG